MVDFLGWVIDSILSFIKSRICSKEELKQKHLADIKKEVLEPMLNNLDETSIPILRGDNLAVDISQKRIAAKGTKATQYGWRWKKELVVPASKHEVNSNLYSDIKKNHYKELVKDFEIFKTEFESYTNTWLTYATEIQNTIAKEVELPSYEGNMDAHFVDAPFLGKYVIERITGLNLIPMVTEGNPPISVFVSGNLTLKGNPEHTSKCIEVVNRICESDTKSNELSQPAGKLLEKAMHLRNDIDKIIKSYKLEGKCGYV